MRTLWNFHSAGQLVFGNDSAREIGSLLAQRKLGRVLVVTDKVLEKVGIVQQVTASLATAGIEFEVFNEGEAEPSIAVALRGTEVGRRFQPTALLGLGGGSNMDLAKIMALLLTHGGEPQQYFGFNNIPGPVLPLVCVPTTAGTGSEVSHAAVLTDTVNKIKVSTLSQHLRPHLAVVDPKLTLSCPKQVTADSGIDALTHAIEAFTARSFAEISPSNCEPLAYEGSHPLGDVLAKQAIELVGQHLETAVSNGSNLVAREGMALAATLAGLAFSNCGVALVHGLEYPIGGVLHCSHGAGNGLLLPYVMRFNLPTCAAKLGEVGRLLGNAPVTDHASTEAAAEQAILTVERLRTSIGIPTQIRQLGGTREQLPGFAEKAFAIKRLLGTNPRTASQADLLEILTAAF